MLHRSFARSPTGVKLCWAEFSETRDILPRRGAPRPEPNSSYVIYSVIACVSRPVDVPQPSTPSLQPVVR